MAKEIERKYLVKKDLLPQDIPGKRLLQGYIVNQKNKSVRIRIADDKAFLTVKAGTKSLTRSEFEYEIPLEDARDMMLLCKTHFIDKHRHIIEFEGMTWEVDVFHGENEGLIVAEIELETEEQQFVLPPWVGEEVTEDPRYLNVSLVQTPYSHWRKEQ